MRVGLRMGSEPFEIVELLKASTGDHKCPKHYHIADLHPLKNICAQ